MIGALIVSAGEPQLERCLESVHNQSVSFSNIVHINNVIPENEAFNQGMSKSVNEWVMKVDGDMILYKNAVEIATQYIQENNEEKTFIYNFGLLDWLLKAPICGCSVFRRSLFLKYPYSNKLKNDYYVSRKLMRIGYVRERPYMKGIIIGNHCDDPNEFQVFRRCYTQGVKWGKRYMLRKLTEQYKETGNKLYDVAIKALWFGTNKGIYPTSHNLDFDRQMLEEFKNENNNSPVT